jgi:uncharacterized SAM-binding protein YcdF (DUF218 family)
MKRKTARWCILAAMLVLAGCVLTAVRGWGMRFSGCLLLGAAALMLAWALLDRLAERGGVWRLGKRVFSLCLALGVGVLCVIETAVINRGRSDLRALPVDAVIVLGAGVNGTQPSLSLRTRLDAALEYLAEHPDIPVVLTGGQGYGEEITEARCMADYLVERGVDPERLLLEEQASDTAENFAFSGALLEQQGVDPAESRIAVVTNDFHIARAELIGEWKQDYGAVIGVPARLPWLHLEVNYYLREAFAVVKTVIFD